MAGLPEIELPSLWYEMTGIQMNSLVNTEPVKLKNQDFVDETITLYECLKDFMPNEEIASTFFISEEKECFVLSYTNSDQSDEIMYHVNGLFERRLMPNVETLLCDPGLALLIAAKKNRSNPSSPRPMYKVNILVRQ